MFRFLFALIATVLMVLAAPNGARANGCQGRDLRQDWDADFARAVATETASLPHAEGRYWEVARDGRASVLYGTIHIDAADLDPLPDSFVRRLRAARELLVELTLAEEKRMIRALLLNPSMILSPPGKSVSTALSQRERSVLAERLKGYGMTLEMADQVAPWYLTLTLGQPACLASTTGTSAHLLDRTIERMATDAGVPVFGLEAYEDVFNLLGDQPFAGQIDMLRTMLAAPDMAEDQLETMRQMYLRGAVQEIRAYGIVDARENGLEDVTEDFMDRLLLTRNHRWMDELLPRLAEGNRVVAVGALHLGGPAGLLELLEAEGFAVRRLVD